MTQPQTKDSQLIDQMNAMISSGDAPNEFSLKKIEREIEASRQALDGGTYYVLKGMVATLRNSFENAISYHNTAIRLLGNNWAYENYAASLDKLGYTFKAFQMHKKAYELDKSDTEYLVSLTRSQMKNAFFEQALEVLNSLSEAELLELGFDMAQASDLIDYLNVQNITAEEIEFIASTAEDVLFANKTVSRRHCSYVSSGEPYFLLEAEIESTPDEAAKLSIEIGEQLAAKEYPKSFTGQVVFRVRSAA